MKRLKRTKTATSYGYPYLKEGTYVKYDTLGGVEVARCLTTDSALYAWPPHWQKGQVVEINGRESVSKEDRILNLKTVEVLPEMEQMRLRLLYG